MPMDANDVSQSPNASQPVHLADPAQHLQGIPGTDQRSEQQWRILEATLSSIADFTYTFDRAGRFVYVNQPLLDLWGRTLQYAVGKNFFDLEYPDDVAERLQHQIQEVFTTGRKVTGEIENSII